jgi:hypothetical protein
VLPVAGPVAPRRRVGAWRTRGSLGLVLPDGGDLVPVLADHAVAGDDQPAPGVDPQYPVRVEHEEYARRIGHADFLREQIGGAAGE